MHIQTTLKTRRPDRGAPSNFSRIAAIAGLVVLLATGTLPNSVYAGEDETPTGVLDAEVRSIPGPRRTVAVGRFASKSDFNYQYGLADVGGGLAALLKAALVESGQFIVVERDLNGVLGEQRLTAAGLVNPEGAAVPGQLLGANLLINGAVTEFNESAGGRGFGIGAFGIGLGLNSRKATVGLSIQVVNATSGQILADYSVREDVTSKSVGIDGARNGISTGYSQFMTTAIGQAARRAITSAVQQLAEEAASRPWTGQVVAFDQGEVVINAGSASGLQVGDTFGIERTAQVFTDPATGRVIGRRNLDMGNVVVSYVDDEIAFGSFESLMNTAPARGDLIVIR